MIVAFSIIDIVVSLFLLIVIILLTFDFLEMIIRKIPPLPSRSKTVKHIFEILEKERKQKGVFVDLGCGSAKVLIAVKKRFPEIETMGYENWPSQFLLAKISSVIFRQKIKIIYKNLFQADLTKADIIFCYLFPHLMRVLERKFEKELKNGALIICNTFPLPHWKPIETIATLNNKTNFGKLFIYKK